MDTTVGKRTLIDIVAPLAGVNVNSTFDRLRSVAGYSLIGHAISERSFKAEVELIDQWVSVAISLRSIVHDDHHFWVVWAMLDAIDERQTRHRRRQVFGGFNPFKSEEP